VEPHLIEILAFKIFEVLMELDFPYFLNDYSKVYSADQKPIDKLN
jgi:hypothetical protein